MKLIESNKTIFEQENLAQQLYSEASRLLTQAKKIKCSGLYIHQKGGILNNLSGPMQLYHLPKTNLEDNNDLMIRALADVKPKIRSLESDLEKLKVSKELREMKLQDKYQWWSK